jgi:DMSO/TMAO reductase YedYZ heme-binding membrane subunit
VSSRRGSRPSRDNYSVARVRSGRRGRAIWVAIILLAVAAAASSPETSRGRDILAAVQRFMLFYSGVLALIALTAAVGVGIVATDRIVMVPGSRVVAQAVHRAVSFAALAFLVTHIVLEILAHRSRVIDAFVPFLAHGRTFYIGLGTVASDLVVLLIVTGIARGRFASRRPGTWRAIHATAYLAWPLSIVHGLLGGRTAKPYVDWSYGACVAAVALALLIRFAATIRSRREKGAHPLPDHAASTIQAPVPAMLPHEERWGVVRQTYDLSSAVPTARRMPRALPAGATDGPAAPYAQGTYIAARRLATPRPDLPIPPEHLQHLQQQRTGQWQQGQPARSPAQQPPVSYPGDSAYPGAAGDLAHPGSTGQVYPPGNGGEVYPPTNADQDYPPSNNDQDYPPSNNDQDYPPTDSDQGYPLSDSDQGYPPTDSDQDYPLSDSDRGYPPTDSDQGYPPTNADQDYPLSDSDQGYPPTDSDQDYAGYRAYPGSEGS